MSFALTPARRARRVAAFAAAVALFAATDVAALTYLVGPGPTCSHATLQGALDAAHANPGADVVRIVRNATWTAQEISIDTPGDVEIVGGFADCDATVPSGKTTLSGAGGNARSVLALRGNGHFRLRHLVIRDGDQAGDDDGGGIHFIGGGIVEISDSDIVENSAEDGGGVYVHGTTNLAELIIGTSVVIASNTARRNGGGIMVQNLEMSMIASGSILLGNSAGGSGGGLMLASGVRSAHAYLGSSGFADLGLVYDNRAAIGGGIAVAMDDEDNTDAILHVFSTDANVPTRIRGNHATQRGGAIDLQPRFDGAFTGFPFGAIALLRNVDILDNSAPVGAAINLAHGNFGPLDSQALGGLMYLGTDQVNPPLHPAAAPCPAGRPCGFVRLNETVNTTGAVIHQSEESNFYASRIAFEGNQGGWLLYLSGEEPTQASVDNSLIVANTVEHALIRDDQNEDDDTQLLQLHHLTISGNTIGANGVLSVNEDMSLTRSIVDQPGKPLFATNVGASGGNREVQYVIVSNPGDVGGTAQIAPRFVDPARGDYGLRAGSQAVDYAPPLDGIPLDLHSQPRSVDQPDNAASIGPSDVGALERQVQQPMVLNADFDTDLRLWGVLSTATWDGSQNAAGAAGSGSVRVPMPSIIEGKRAKLAGGLSQCIHVPGPGTYQLNGWGRVLPSSNPPLTANRAALRWELRGDGGDSGCEAGAPDQTGGLVLASTGTWSRPEAGATIVVPPATWTRNTSIVVTFDVQGAPANSPTAWFDGITLARAGDIAVEMFANGFE